MPYVILFISRRYLVILLALLLVILDIAITPKVVVPLANFLSIHVGFIWFCFILRFIVFYLYHAYILG